ncbi:MAG: hypothetical protein ABJ275_08055 [Maricaulaceae bacterium]
MARLSPSFFALMALASLGLSAPLQAQVQPQAHPQNDAATCLAFANLGGIVADYILPISLRDYAAMNSGKDPQRVQGLVNKIDRELSQTDKQAFSRHGPNNSALLEEASTELAINLVLDGHASNPQGISSFMLQDCRQATPSRIIEIQGQAHQDQSQTTR